MPLLHKGMCYGEKQPATDTHMHFLFLVGIRMHIDISYIDAKAHIGVEKKILLINWDNW